MKKIKGICHEYLFQCQNIQAVCTLFTLKTEIKKNFVQSFANMLKSFY